VAIASFITYTVQIVRIDAQERDYVEHLEYTIGHGLEHHLHDFEVNVRILAQMGSLAGYIKQANREKLYEELKPVWHIMTKEEPNLKVMQLHLPNGDSLLRMHDPERFGDDLREMRPMIAAVHAHHQIQSGLEVGVHGAMYRIITPLFDEDSRYVGAIELGFDPKFLLEMVYRTNGYRGAIFIEQSELEKIDFKSSMVIDGFGLYWAMEGIDGVLLEELGKHQHLHSLKVVQHLQHLHHLYLYSLGTTLGQTNVKLLFFHDVSQAIGLDETHYTLVGLSGLALFGVMLWLLNRRIDAYHDAVVEQSSIQLEQLSISERDLKNTQRYLESIQEVIPNMILTHESGQIRSANRATLEFFGYEHLEDLLLAHTCICDRFVACHNCLNAKMGRLTWVEYILAHPNDAHYVRMNRGNNEYRFSVKAKTFLHENQERVLIIFTDVTELEQIKERYEFAANGVNDGLWDWDVRRNTIYFAPQWKRMIGYDDSELPNAFEEWEKRVHPDDLPKAMAAIEASMAKPNVPYRAQFRLRHKDGHWVWIMDRGQTIFDEEGHPIRMVGYHTDISEHKNLELQLLQSQQLFDLFMLHLPYYVAIKDEEFHIIYANPRAKGFLRKPLVGSKSQENLGKEASRIVDTISHQALKHGKAEEVVTYNVDGKEYIFRVLAFAIPQADGKTFVGMFYIDITHQYQAQHELKRSEAQLRLAQHIAQLGYWESYAQQELLSYSDEVYAILGLDKDHYAPTLEHFYMCVHPEDVTLVKETFDSSIAAHAPYHVVHRIVRVDNGEIRYVEERGDHSYNAYGEYERTYGTIQDITQQVKLQKELDEKEEVMIAQSRHAAMGEMIGMIAHQWRQPISVIAMGANNMLVDIALEDIVPERFEAHAQGILNQTEYLSKTIDDFRNFFRPDKERENVGVDSVLNEAVNIIGKSLENSNIALVLDVKKAPPIFTYSRELLHVFINILKNAKEALQDAAVQDAKIEVTIFAREERIITRICDNGPAIAAEVLPHIFEPYFTTKNEKNGTGLGLYMSKTIIEKHLHGTISAANTAQGVCFEVCIPMMQE